MSVYTAIFLGICGRKFPYMQKYFFAYAEIYFRIYGKFPAYIQMFPPSYRAGDLQALGTPICLLSRDKATGMRSLRTRLGTTSARTARCSANDSIFAL